MLSYTQNELTFVNKTCSITKVEFFFLPVDPILVQWLPAFSFPGLLSLFVWGAGVPGWVPLREQESQGSVPFLLLEPKMKMHSVWWVFLFTET